MRFLGFLNIKPNSSIYTALKKVYGINEKTALNLCQEFSVYPRCPVSDINYEILDQLKQRIEEDKEEGRPILIEGDLKKLKSSFITEILSSGTYKSFRHKNGLPVRGQRTRSNGRTQKRRLNLKELI